MTAKPSPERRERALAYLREQAAHPNPKRRDRAAARLAELAAMGRAARRTSLDTLDAGREQA